MHPLGDYLRDLAAIHATGAAGPETSYYGALETLLNAAGKLVKPRVRCVLSPADRGAGIPDAGLFTVRQFERAADAEPLPGQMPERGVVEAKPPASDVRSIAAGEQVVRYGREYGHVFVTNYRDFLLVGHDLDGRPVELESFTLAASAEELWQIARHPEKAGTAHAERFLEFLKRALLHAATLEKPNDVAWFLASYARDARIRIEGAEMPALAAVRQALEDALGVRFEGPRGDHFFRSTLIQTLFYGVFSAWVLWHRQSPPKGQRFDWRQAAWTLHVPMIQALFDQVAAPARLRPLGLVEPLDWAAAVLDRVDGDAFFSRFEEEHAVQYFYEPFLEAFDPELRRELGVWYTPPEVVRYMVARVDAALRNDLGIAAGLADPRVYVLDPCCGTGAFLVETLRTIADTLAGAGADALLAADVRRAACERVFGFELLPAPFVVAHLQLGLLLRRLGSAPQAARGERLGVFLTNALTGWQPPGESGRGRFEQLKLNFPELAQERDAANEVKRERPILVILGNPPYNGFAGVAVDEERELTEAYRTTEKAPSPQGQGLNDLYVRFYRMAERKIVEESRKGVVAFISNYSWLDGLSHTGMRERFLDVFDEIRIDNLNGDKYKTGKLTPTGEPDPSVFSTEWNREGIQVGTAIALMVRKERHEPASRIRFRNRWGKHKRQELVDSRLDDDDSFYEILEPVLDLGLPFLPATMAPHFREWPRLPELFPMSFPGVKTSRDDLLVDIDRGRLEERLRCYFDPATSHEEMARICPAALRETKHFPAREVRETLQRRGFLPGNVVRYVYRPFDLRWLYWEPETNLLDRRRQEYWQNLFSGNLWLEARQKLAVSVFDRGYVTHHLADNFGNGLSSFFPLYRVHGWKGLFTAAENGPVANVSSYAERVLKELDLTPEDLFFHTVAVIHAPSYRQENVTALRQDWPRVPLPRSRDSFFASAELGRRVALLLDSEASVRGVTVGPLDPELQGLGVFSLVPGHALDEERDLAVTAGWGHPGKGGVVMPGRGRIRERAFTPDEREALKAGASGRGLAGADARTLLGERTLDVYLNERAFFRNVPAGVWSYTLGGYQVIKKWLSYRELDFLERPLTSEEARAVTALVRRIAALLLLQPSLDANYVAVRDSS
jgi:hypothetical protein